MTVRSGHCLGGPKDKQLLATHNPGVVRPDDSGGFYVHFAANGPTPSGWRWVEPAKKGEMK